MSFKTIPLSWLLFFCSLLSMTACDQDDNPCIHAVVLHETSPTNLTGPCTSPDYFRDVLDMLRIAQCKTVFASDIVSYLRQNKIPENHLVALTFDDGWAGNYDFAHPLLWQYGMKATAFVFTSGIDDGRPRHLNWDDLDQMKKSGTWEIHSHGDTHSDFALCDKEQRIQELTSSLAKLKQHAFCDPALIAYPFGHCNPDVLNQTKDIGYKAAFIASSDGRIFSHSNLYEIPRTTICQLFNQDLVCRKLGLELQTLRKQLAIYDDKEMRWDDHWNEIQVSDSTPQGQYGRTYRTSTQKNSSLTISFPIETDGDYELSTWLPCTQSGSTPFRWKWEITSDKRVDQGSAYGSKMNGWNRLLRQHFKKGTFSLNVFLSTADDSLVLFDALKIEKING